MKSISVAVLGALLIAAHPAMGQSWPAKPIRLIVHSTPGGFDTPARLMAPKLLEDLGQPVVIEHRPGGGGMIGTDAVAKAPPDGYTLLYGTSSPLVSSAFLHKSLPYRLPGDFTPITVIYQSRQAITVNASSDIRSLQDLIDTAKKNPGKLTFSSTGIGSAFHLHGEILKQTAGIELVHVPYKGLPEALADVVAGRIDMTFANYINLKAQLDGGKVRALAMIESSRHPRLPGVPSIVEVLPSYQKAPSWVAVVAPANVPRPLVARLNAAFVKAVNAPDVRPKIEADGTRVVGNTPEEFEAMWRRDLDLTGRVIKAAGIPPE